MSTIYIRKIALGLFLHFVIFLHPPLQVGATTSLNLVVEDKLVSCCYQQALKCNQDAYLCADPTHLLLVVVTFILVSKESKTQSSFQATLLLPSQSYDCSDIMTAARPFRSLKKWRRSIYFTYKCHATTKTSFLEIVDCKYLELTSCKTD